MLWKVSSLYPRRGVDISRRLNVQPCLCILFSRLSPSVAGIIVFASKSLRVGKKKKRRKSSRFHRTRSAILFYCTFTVEIALITYNDSTLQAFSLSFLVRESTMWRLLSNFCHFSARPSAESRALRMLVKKIGWNEGSFARDLKESLWKQAVIVAV